MIVEMKKAYIVVQQQKSRQMLKALRKAGMVHLESETYTGEVTTEVQKQIDTVSRIRSAIAELQPKKEAVRQEHLSFETSAEVIDRYDALLDEKRIAEERIAWLTSRIEVLEPWGEFDPAELAMLKEEGIEFFFYTLSKKDRADLGPEISYIPLAPVEGREAIAVIGSPLPSTVVATQLAVGTESLSALKSQRSALQSTRDEALRSLKRGGQYLDALTLQIQRLEMAKTFEEVAHSMNEQEELAWIAGFLPVDQVEHFQRVATENSWAYLIDAVSEEDAVPTLVKYRKGVGIIKPIFDILGTVPGYHEGDISTWFLLFFTLFFAMIVGDAGYGLIFFLAALGMHIKMKKPTTIVMLLYVLSLATIVWGSLTGTWFASITILENIPLLKKLVIPQIANYPELFGVHAVTAQNTVMKFCFIVGTVQLSLACALNVVRKAPAKDLSLVADLGWLTMILALYFIVLQLVIGTVINLPLIFSIVGGGFALVILFGAQGPSVPFFKGVGAGLGGLFTTFLDTISAFSNIMSYIRLFAVGMASVAIAQSFNEMASSMNQGFAIIAGILVLVIGHSLNLVMGLLSVVVHGVRLNLLEFSGQLGMEWTGVAYKPFAQTVEEQ